MPVRKEEKKEKTEKKEATRLKILNSNKPCKIRFEDNHFRKRPNFNIFE